MNKLVFSVLTIVWLNAHAQENSVSSRDAIRAVMPAAIEVIERIERERGHQLNDTELHRMINSTEFKHRLEERVRDNPAFAPCRIDLCSSA